MKYAIVKAYAQHASTRANELWSNFDSLEAAEAKADDLMLGWGWSDKQIEDRCDGDCTVLIYSSAELGGTHDNGAFELVNERSSNTSSRSIEWSETEQGRNELAANDVDGVYVCENPTPHQQRQDGIVVLQDMDFYEALKTATSTIYGNVSDEVAALIDLEYGIR